MRQKCIVGNWKMNKTASEAKGLVAQLLKELPSAPQAQVILAPPFTALQAVRHGLPPSHRFQLAGQNMHWEDQGAFTGEISAAMLFDLGCTAVILGHSERRQHFGEKDIVINKKVHVAIRHQLSPILCVGESLAEREQGNTNHVVTNQLQIGLEGLAKEVMSTVCIAYEPVWAIGTGKAATLSQAVEVHQVLRQSVAQTWGEDISQGIRILYGGSVTPTNAQEFLKSEDIDGALVGGACLNPDAFATIIKLA